MVNTWIAASMVAVIAGIIGFFVVLRGAEFVAHALPQGAFAGAAGAALIGANTILGLGTFALAGALGIAWLGRRSHHSVATALGLVVMLGLGSMFLSLSVEYGPEIYSLLFGEVIGVSRAELLPIVALGLVCSGAIAVLYRPLLFDSVMPGVSEAKGMSRAGINVVFLVVVALATSMTVPVVGAFLMFSLMVAPAAAARCLTDRPGRALALSAGIALVVVWAAIVASFESNWPIGFFVGTLGAFAYVVARAVQHLRGRNYRASRPVAPLVSAAFR